MGLNSPSSGGRRKASLANWVSRSLIISALKFLFDLYFFNKSVISSSPLFDGFNDLNEAHDFSDYMIEELGINPLQYTLNRTIH